MTYTRYSNRKLPDMWPWVLTLLALGGIFAVFGVRLWYIGAICAGCLMWWHSIRKITNKDGKIILVISIETGEITPYIVGRDRWRQAEKVGRPFGNFSTASGNYVDVLTSYDPNANVATYPDGGEFSDMYIASIPERYKELIDNLGETKKENIELKQQGDIRAIEIARENISKFADEINNVLTPRKSNSNAKVPPKSDDGKEKTSEVEDGN